MSNGRHPAAEGANRANSASGAVLGGRRDLSDELPVAEVGDQVAYPGPAPVGALSLLKQPGVEDLLQRFLNRGKASTIEAYRKDRDQGQATGWSSTTPVTCARSRRSGSA